MNRRDAETQRFIESGFSKRGVDVRFRIVLVSLFVLCVSASVRFNQAQAQTLSSETQKQINAILDAPNLKEAHIGISILDLGTVKDARAFPAKPYIGKPHRVLFERDANKSFMPASNMKLFTAAIALQLLGKDRTFPTRVVKLPKNQSLGFARDYYVLVGGGDPSLTEEGLKYLATQVAKTGVRVIEVLRADGTIYGAETLLSQYPFGWLLDDTAWYYGAPVSALAYNRNQVDVTILGGERVGSRAHVECALRPRSLLFDVLTGTPDLANKSEEQLLVIQSLHGETYIFGKVAPSQKLSFGLAVPSHSDWIADQFSAMLKQSGVEAPVTRGTVDFYSRHPDNYNNWDLVAEFNSPPLKVLFQRFLKNSDNLYAEMLLRDAAYYHDGTGGDKAGPRAHELLKKWLIGQGIDITALRFEDGSGLSRYNLLTPRATSELLAAINSMKDGDVIWDALPIGGVNGTMKNRVKNTPAQNNARAKSGTFSIASNLSGYVTTRDNHRLAVSLYMNFARDGVAARKAQDAVFVALANARIQTAKPQAASHSQSTPAPARR